MVVANLPRSQRSFYRTQVALGLLPLLLFGPKFVPQYAGKTGYFYGTRTHNGELVLISKNPAATRDSGRDTEAIHRFGRKASEYRTAKKLATAA